MAEATSRLILQVDAAVALAQSNLRALANSVEVDSRQIDGSLRRVDAAHNRLTSTLGNARAAQMEMMHVTRAMSDGFAAGIPIQQLFFSEIGRIGEAAAMTGGAMGKLGAFLGGPWGMIVVAATSVLGTLFLAHHKSAEGAKDQKIEDMDLAEALKKLSDATKGAITSEREHQIELLKSADAVRQKALHIRDLTRAMLQQALDEQKAQNIRSTAPGQAGELGTLGAANANAQVSRLQALLAQNDAAAARADQLRSSALVPLIRQRALELTDPTAGVRGAAQRKIDALTEAFTKLGDNSDAAKKRLLAAEIQIINARDAEIKKIDEQKSATRSNANRMTGREVTGAEAASIARAAGLQVNSASRTYGQQKALYDAWVAAGMPKDNPVARPGTSAHEGARGRWALDIQLGAGVTPDLLRKVFSAQGISLSKVFLERGHFHVEGNRSQADAEYAAAHPTTKQKPIESASATRERLAFEEGYFPDTATPGYQLPTQQLSDMKDLLASIGSNIPDLGKMLTTEDQARLQAFSDDFVGSLSSGLADAIVNGRNLGDVLVDTFKRVGAEMLASGILNLLTGGKQGSSFGSILANMGSLFGRGGGTAAGAGSGLSHEFAHFAAGGFPPVGVASLVGEKGPELFIPRQAGVIIPNHMLGGQNDNRPISISVTPSKYFDAHVTDGAGRVVAAAAPSLIDAGGQAGQSMILRRASRAIP